eukprot:67476_1
MPKYKKKWQKEPEGFDLIKDKLDEFDEKMREATDEDHEGKRKNEALWPIFQIHHQKSRYVYEMYYKKKKITRPVYEFCLKLKHADPQLIAKWKKPGYERLCCLRCIETKDHNFQTTCICRVPKAKLEAGKVVECTHCGCRGCASGD